MSRFVRKAHRATALVAGVVGAVLVAGVAPAMAAPGGSIPTIPEGSQVLSPTDPIDTGGTVEDSGTPQTLGTPFVSGKYIVALSRPPIASYTGGTAGIPATKPDAGAKVAVESQAAQDYSHVLESDQSSTADSVGATPTQQYTVAFNGFAADLSAEQAQTLAGSAGVLSVTKDGLLQATDDRRSTDFLKLSGDSGVWQKVGGTELAGKGIVVGVIDTGIWPESASFKADPLGDAPDPADPTKAYRQGDQIIEQKANGQTFTGECVTGDQFTADLCNTKIISARYFGDSFLAGVPANLLTDYVSPRDGDGHGSHTASTAAGNADVQATVDGRDWGKISGVAPAASIAVYKALWEAKAPAASGGATSDIVAAIDQAVADGVDVINYSVGSSSESTATSPIQLAFLSAASAGIFVSASAGNSGPGAATMDNTQPWLTTVGASTVQRYEATVQLGNGASYSGVSTTVTDQVGPLPLVAGENSGITGSTPALAAQCTDKTLDPDKVRGRIVECDRGGNARVAKSAEVARAGGVGMVMVDLADAGPIGDFHTVPTVEIDIPNGVTVKAYAKTANATATLVPGNSGQAMSYPQVIGFSSRGPAKQTQEDILKPDLVAPGVDILAAVSPPTHQGRDFDLESGTSMAAPHVAGLAAIYKGVHPDWSPMAIKSALMTTAYNTKNRDGSALTDPFAQGAGEVDPSRMLTPALVYDAGQDDWLGYLEGLGVATGTGVAAVDPSDYNQASIADGALVGTKTITRKVTSVTPGLYRATISVPGFRATVSPSILNFTAAGQTKQFKVTLTRTSAALSSYAKGFLTWSGANTTVRAPIAVKPVALTSSASSVQIEGTGGSASWTVTSGIAGTFPITANGLVPATDVGGEVTSTTVKQYQVAVPAGTKLARFETKSEASGAGADIDVLVAYVTPTGATVVGQSAGPTADERVDLTHPAAGTYIVQVSGFADAPGTTSTPYTFRNFVVGGPVGNLTVDPASSTTRAGQTFTVTATAANLDAAKSYLGWVEYPDQSGTVVEANPDK